MSISSQPIAEITDPIASVSPQPADATGGSRTLSLSFTGSAGEYFRIWIVNICLTLLTFGVFSAWAKVRKKRYFYSHTVLDGTPLQYLGQPIPILKGRIVGVVLFGIWYVGTHYIVELLPLVIVLFVGLAPWVLVRSAAFNARYSAYRNITFQFSGTYWSAAKMLYGWALITVITGGLGFPWWQQRLKRYMVTRLQYGAVPGEFTARGGQFFRVYLLAGLLFSSVFIFVAIAIGMSAGLHRRGAGGGELGTYIVGLTLLAYTLYVAAFAYTRARLGNLVWNQTSLGPLRFQSRLRARTLLRLYVTNALGILASAGLLIPWATIRTLRYRIDHFAIATEDELTVFRGSPGATVQATAAEVGELFDFDMSI